jgi:hypothetical protein
VSGKIVILPVAICEVKDLGKVETEWRTESMLRTPALIDIISLKIIGEELIRDYYPLHPHKSSLLKKLARMNMLKNESLF